MLFPWADPRVFEIFSTAFSKSTSSVYNTLNKKVRTNFEKISISIWQALDSSNTFEEDTPFSETRSELHIQEHN
jgi:hypothetical protein